MATSLDACKPIASDALFDWIDYYWRPLAIQMGLELRYRSDGSVLASDPGLLEQSLVNLATNALRNTKQGSVLIASRQRGERIGLSVRDTGSSFAEADLERVFDVLVQVGNPQRNRRKGMELCLVIVRRAAQLLGTEVQVQSVPGHGTLSYLSQPPAQSDQTLEYITFALLDDPISGQNLLIVGDDPDVRTALITLTGQWEVFADDPSRLCAGGARHDRCGASCANARSRHRHPDYRASRTRCGV